MANDESLFQTDEEIWQWPRFNPPGLLIGPVPMKRSPLYPTCWVPNYSHPGVAQRIAVEVDFYYVTQEPKRRF